jgi:hypothetical protein
VQPRDVLAPRGLAWRIDCDNDLRVTIAVVEKYVLLLSGQGRGQPDANWRLGTYLDANEAQRRAVEMTGSYERLRHGVVGQYAELALPRDVWVGCTESGTVDPLIGFTIHAALGTEHI